MQRILHGLFDFPLPSVSTQFWIKIAIFEFALPK